MNFLSAKELKDLIYLDFEGANFIGYKFKISNSPCIRVTKEAGKITCSCKNHTIHADKKTEKVKCRFIEAYKIYDENKKYLG